MVSVGNFSPFLVPQSVGIFLMYDTIDNPLVNIDSVASVGESVGNFAVFCSVSIMYICASQECYNKYISKIWYYCRIEKIFK